MDTFHTQEIDANTRVRWVWDGMYETRGSYAYDTEEETKRAEDEELAKLESGEWAALGMIVETRCPHCNLWKEHESVWGVVIDVNTEALDGFAAESGLLP